MCRISGVIEVVDHFTRIFSGNKNVRVQEKVQDVQDLGGHILARRLPNGDRTKGFTFHVF